MTKDEEINKLLLQNKCLRDEVQFDSDCSLYNINEVKTKLKDIEQNLGQLKADAETPALHQLDALYDYFHKSLSSKLNKIALDNKLCTSSELRHYSNVLKASDNLGVLIIKNLVNDKLMIRLYNNRYREHRFVGEARSFAKRADKISSYSKQEKQTAISQDVGFSNK